MLYFLGKQTASWCLLVNISVQNYYDGLHGGAVAAIAERVAIACAKTVIAEDKEIFLGELSISYLSAAPKNVSYFTVWFCLSRYKWTTFTLKTCIKVHSFIASG